MGENSERPTARRGDYPNPDNKASNSVYHSVDRELGEYFQQECLKHFGLIKLGVPGKITLTLLEMYGADGRMNLATESWGPCRVCIREQNLNCIMHQKPWRLNSS